MGLPIRFCQEGFLGHNYLLRPMLYILGDKVCQTQGVSSVWINFPGRTLLQDLEWRGSCTPTSVEERLLSLSHFLHTHSPPGRSDARVWPGISSTLSSLQPGPPSSPSLLRAPLLRWVGEACWHPATPSRTEWVSSTWVGKYGLHIRALFFKSVLSRIKLIR